MKIIQSFEHAPVIFHYNKKHNEDPSVPCWILKVKGETHYVNHVEISPGVGFSTKETPDNAHTKGAIKIKGKLTLHENALGEIEGIIS
jgi:nitrate reductase beta subunit